MTIAHISQKTSLFVSHFVLKIKSKYFCFKKSLFIQWETQWCCWSCLYHLPFTFDSFHKSRINAFLKLSCSQYPPSSRPISRQYSFIPFVPFTFNPIAALCGRPNRQLWGRGLGGPQSLMESQMDKNFWGKNNNNNLFTKNKNYMFTQTMLLFSFFLQFGNISFCLMTM